MTDTNDKSDIPDVSDLLEKSTTAEAIARSRFSAFWIALYVLLVASLIVYAIYIVWNIDYRGPDYYAARTLYSIGHAQIGYKGSNNNGEYGTFEALDSVGCPGGYTLDDLIVGYWMTWDVSKVPHNNEPGLLHPVFSTYTIIAYPRHLKYRWRELSTFGITDDNIDPEPTVRRYSPENGDDVSAVRTWDPIL